MAFKTVTIYLNVAAAFKYFHHLLSVGQHTIYRLVCVFSLHCVYALSMSTERCEVMNLTNSVINKSLLNAAIEIALSCDFFFFPFLIVLCLAENDEALSYGFYSVLTCIYFTFQFAVL